MKQILLGMLSLFFFGAASAQKVSSKDVPSVILNSFQTKYRNAEDVEWKKKQGYYEVEFEVSKRDFEIKYSPNGKILAYDEELDTAGIPAAVQATVRAQYPTARIKEAKKKEKDNTTIYKLEIKNPEGKEWDLVLDPAGKVLSAKED